MPVARMSSPKQTETEVAVLQVQYKNLDDKVEEIKDELKELRQHMTNENEDMKKFLKEMRDSDTNAHTELGKKVSALEKWRWMMMGAGVVIGALGFETMAKLLK